MRKQILFLALFLCSSTAAAQSVGPPFSPVPKLVDHVVRMVTKDGSRSTVLRTVTHHGDWTRVVEEGRASTTYFNAAIPTSITVRRDPDITYLEILKGRRSQSSIGWDDSFFKTEERQTIAGEACEIWHVGRSRHSDLTKFSCVTPDGIELSHKYVGRSYVGSSAEAVAVERRTVQSSEVEHGPSRPEILA